MSDYLCIFAAGFTYNIVEFKRIYCYGNKTFIDRRTTEDFGHD